MQNIEHFDDIYKALKKEIKKAQTATDPSVISDVERMTNLSVLFRKILADRHEKIKGFFLSKRRLRDTIGTR